MKGPGEGLNAWVGRERREMPAAAIAVMGTGQGRNHGMRAVAEGEAFRDLVVAPE